MATADRPAGPAEPADHEPDLEGDEAAQSVALGRLLAFSDGVFAIAITILVLDLAVPDGLTDGGLADALRDQLPNLAAAALSFAVIGRFWIAHHAIFRRVRRADGRLLSLNLLLLGPIVLLPFVTKLLADYGTTTLAVTAYSATVAAVGLAELAIVGYATRGRRLVDPRLPAAAVTASIARTAWVALAFLVAIPVALLSPFAAYACWGLSALPADRILARLGAQTG